MAAIVPDILLQRIDSLTGELNPSVSRADGASFALALSMIFHAQQQIQTASAASPEAPVAAPASRDALYSAELVGRLGEALQTGQRGELALLVSWLEEAPLPAARRLPAARTEGVPMAQAALLAKSYTLLDEINQSSLSVAA